VNVHRLQREQYVDRPLAEVFRFFAGAQNLERIFADRHEAVPRLLG
jgi:hypothetical protein